MMRFLSLLFAASCAAASTLSDDDLRAIPGPGKDFDIHDGKLLAPILIPRVSGTEGNFKTQAHFVDFFASELPTWRMSWQNSTSKTPVTGNTDVPFSNIILRRDPPWTEGKEGDVSRLTLVAHFDTLYEPAGFIGATDSAAPCAMLMHVARSVDEALTAKWKKMEEDGDVLDTAEGVQILFLDGEEAFLHWSDTDSLYGARSLAEEWEHTFHPSSSTFSTPLKSISLFVLLDLLGSPDPRIPSYFLPTHWAYKKMSDIEKRLRDLSLLATKPKASFLPEPVKAANKFGPGGIEDDHIPFMRRGVDILHVIPSPFPDVWHNHLGNGIEDDAEHLDIDTVNDWSIIVTAFVAEMMDLGGFVKSEAGQKRDEEGPRTKTEL